MCGIVGIVDPGGGVAAETVTAMRETLVHRGPDDAGAWVAPDGTVGLGHRRLSILDLGAEGRQPMTDSQGRAQIVYNGEVYNFRQLRSELTRRGYAFRSDTDTEVILNAYLAWGIDCIARLEGMFALAIYDSSEAVTYLVRDRLGIKPLCYSLEGGRLIFGSEIRSVLAGGMTDRSLCPAAAYDFFSYGYVPTPATIYRNVRKLPPATILSFRDGEVKVSRYWQPPFESLDDGPAKARRRLVELVDQSVEDYLVADVPTGTYLSGGLDSTIITHRAADIFRAPDAASRRLGGTKLHTFSMGFDVAEHTELHYARAAAEQYETVHTERIVTGEMAHDIGETIIDLFDEPFAASSTIPMTFLAEMAREQVTVALCGEGGDEAFGGYSWYRWWLKFRQPSFWRTPAGQAVRRIVEAIRGRAKRKWRLPTLESVDLYAQLMGALTGEDKRRVFSPELIAGLGDHDDSWYFRQHWRADLPPMARMQYVDMMTFLPDLNLTRADRTSMRVSLELRVPLLNHQLIEYVCGLSEGVRNPDATLKGLFKQALGDRLPQPIRQRKKKGFSAPLKHWFSGSDLARLVADVKAERPELARSWLHPQLEHFARKTSGSRAYKLYVFLTWLRKHA